MILHPSNGGYLGCFQVLTPGHNVAIGLHCLGIGASMSIDCTRTGVLGSWVRAVQAFLVRVKNV